MAILDDVIGVFSPGWKAARLRSRAVIQAYEAVKTTRTHKARRENRTADQLSQYGAVSLREQARYLDNNHDLVIGVFDKLEERVVGKNGIIVESHIRYYAMGPLPVIWQRRYAPDGVNGLSVRKSPGSLPVRCWNV